MAKKPKSKLDRRFGVDLNGMNFDYMGEDDVESNSITSSEPSEHPAGKLQQFLFKEHVIDTTKKIPAEIVASTESKPYKYIQMELDVEAISPEFEKELQAFDRSSLKSRPVNYFVTRNPADVKIVVKLYNRAFMRGNDPWSPATVEQFAQIMGREDTLVLVTSIGHEDVGFIIVDLEGENKDVGVICGLGTDPRWQRRGIAKFLGLQAWVYLKKMNVKKIKCEVFEENIPSYNLIKSLKFVETGDKVYYF